MKKLVFTLCMFVLLCQLSFAQKLETPSFMYSHKKISKLILEDGTVLECYIKDIDRKKGLIEEIKVMDNGKKRTFKPEQIKAMYLPPSGLDKVLNTSDYIYDATKWDTDLDKNVLSKGYVYFEKSTVKLKKGKEVLMMQLLNPSFSNKIKIYHDPRAKETASFGVAGITVAGGDDKSYYVKKGNDDAYKVLKKTYDKEFPKLYGDCPDFLKLKQDRIKWASFEEDIYNYSQTCKS